MTRFGLPVFGMTGWSDAPSVMLAAAATHADVSSTVYYAVWCRANYFLCFGNVPSGSASCGAHTQGQP